MLRRALRLALASFVAVVASLAGARVAHADVHVERSAEAEACPDAASFESRIRESGEEGATGSSSIEVRFERTMRGYRSLVRTADGKERTIAEDAATCDGLAEATVLAVKLALDLDGARSPDPPRSAASGPTASADDGALPPASSASRRAAPAAEVSASGVVAFGLASRAAAGVRAGGAVVLGGGRWSLGITGLALPSQTHRVGDGTVDVTVLGGGIEGCGRVRGRGRLQLALCARAEALRLAGSADGFPRAESRVRPLFTSSLLGRARVPVAGPVAVVAEAGAVLPIVRERFAIDTLGVVYEPPVVGATTGIGAVVDFE